MSTTPSHPGPRRGARMAAVAAVTAALVLATASTDESEPARVEDGGTTTTGARPEVFAVGDLVELGDWQVRVHGVTDPVRPAAESIVTPAPGHRWVAVDTEVTNTGAEPQDVSSLLCFEVLDEQDRSYTLTVTGEPGSSPPDGEVAAGGSRRGTLTYEVPADAAGLRLTFQCDLLSTGSATIALG
ncbi:MAG TPA: DUF4352 domain-containing protein [Acidimicrobiales bacterium]|nr:DUF4352 domain-containing protein [Acidimicrobiales bacterium]